MEIDEDEIVMQMAEIALHRGTYLDLKLLLPEISSIDDFHILQNLNESNVNADENRLEVFEGTNKFFIFMIYFNPLENIS